MEILEISVDEYRRFVDSENGLASIAPDLSRVKGSGALTRSTLSARSSFTKVIENIRERVNDPLRGIAAVDIPSRPEQCEIQDAFWGCVTALSIANNIFTPQLDLANDTPFTVYAASSQNSQSLAAAGLAPMAPETKLGFHTDGTVKNGTVSIPRHIMLYNVAIEYDRPGSFYWVPFQTWTERKRFANSLGVGKKYRIALTASVYQSADGKLENAMPPEVEVPIFFPNESGEIAMYLNGRVVGAADGSPMRAGVIEELKESLAHERHRYAIPQRARRVIFAANRSGAHARDVFEDARPNVAFNRIFMRSIDSDAYAL